MHLPVMSMAVNSSAGSSGCPDLEEGTVLVSGWAQLAVCIIIVALCCCCTLLCLCTSCVCCTSSVQPAPAVTVPRQTVCSVVISDKPPSYEEAQRQMRSDLPTYQEALRRSGQPPPSEAPPSYRPHFLDS